MDYQAISPLFNLPMLGTGRSRSVSPENFTGEKGGGGRATEGTGAQAARDLGQGWKVSPSIVIQPEETAVLANIAGSGVIQHFWITTHPQHWRSLILEMFWDQESSPSVRVPLGDFFCHGWSEPAGMQSLMVAVNPRGGFNSYWPMPFRDDARIVLSNIGPKDAVVYYQIDYCEDTVAPEAAYFHAQWRRSHPLATMQSHVIADEIRGQGHWVGTYLAWQTNHTGWWGEGEVKFYLDGDDEFPTICGTGTEDYFGGAWDFEQPIGHYQAFSAPFSGFHQVIQPDGLYQSQTRFGMYRWHVADRIQFQQDLKVTIQALGWRKDGRYLPLQDDIASVAYWYQSEPHHPVAVLSPDELDNT